MNPGGQRARVALARALFSGALLLLLDDVFSALDTKTSLELWNRVFCSDLLQGETIILVTQNTWVACEANATIAMDNGRILSVTKREGHVRTAKAIHQSSDRSRESDATHMCESANQNAEGDKNVALVADQITSVAGNVGPLLGKSLFLHEQSLII